MKQPLKVFLLVPVVALFAAGCATSQAASPSPSGPPGSPSAGGYHGSSTSTHRGGGFGMNMPQGSKPFFGTVSDMSGSTLTVGGRATTTVDIVSGTQFQGGAQSDIKSGTRIAGYGTANSDGSINAQSIMVNPAMPAGGPPGGRGNFPRGAGSSTHSWNSSSTASH